MLQLTSFIGLLFVLLHALGNNLGTAHAHRGKEGISMAGKPVSVSDQKEVTDDHGISIAGSRMIGLGGRKMVGHKVLLRKFSEAEMMNHGETSSTTTTSSKNSGKDIKASSNSHGKPQHNMILLDNADDEFDDHKLTDETRRLLKATREIVSLMHKDYHGMGRRKPPINNHEPQH